LKLVEELEEKIRKSAQLILDAKVVVAFTGAGISTESGLKDFRGDYGLWKKFDPYYYANYRVFLERPKLYWTMVKEERYGRDKKVEPNPAHLALAELEVMNRLDCIITQNVDGLHQIAGNKKVIEIHGSSRTSHCMKCKREFSYGEIAAKLELDEITPTCNDCRGVLKSDTVLFGEPLPVEPFNEALWWAESADLMLVIGSSLTVFPAAELPKRVIQRGKKAILINLTETPFDADFDLIFYEKAGKILPFFVKEVRKEIGHTKEQL